MEQLVEMVEEFTTKDYIKNPVSILLSNIDTGFLVCIYTVASSMSAFNSLNHFKFTKWCEREFSFMRRK